MVCWSHVNLCTKYFDMLVKTKKLFCILSRESGKVFYFYRPVFQDEKSKTRNIRFAL